MAGHFSTHPKYENQNTNAPVERLRDHLHCGLSVVLGCDDLPPRPMISPDNINFPGLQPIGSAGPWKNRPAIIFPTDDVMDSVADVAMKLANDVIQIEEPVAASPEPDPHVSKKQARRIAAQLFRLDETAVACRDRGGCWITVYPEGHPTGTSFRGATWFDVLQKIHAFLVDQVRSNPEAAEEATNESGD